MSLNTMSLLRGSLVRIDQFRRMQMTKNSAERQPNAIGSHPVSPENERQTAERRRFEDALEDDEVYEALTSLHPPAAPAQKSS